MSGPPPPPPPPHGEAPKTTAGGGSNLPPGKYDVFIIPDHSAGGGFLYLPSLRPNTNSFIAGFASALFIVVLGQTLAPAFQTWWANFQGMGNAGMALLVIAVGLGAWSLGRTTSDTSGRGANSWGGGGFYSGGSSMPGGAGGTGGFTGAGPSPHGAPPSSGPPPDAHSPPPPGGPKAGANNPNGSYQRPPESPPKPQQTKPKPQADTSKNAWEKAREEVRKKEEERKAKEAEDKRKAEAAQRLKELREKEARERAQREAERARREQEAREKAAREQQARDREAREKEAKERKEKELREARERELKERLARDREERRKRVEADRKRKEEEAERKRKEEEAERRRIEEAERRRIEEVERKRMEEVERRRMEEVERRRMEEAERQRKQEAERKRKEEEAEKKRREEDAANQARKSSTYAFSGVGEKMSPWPNGKPPSVAPTSPPPPPSSTAKRPPPPPTATSVGDDADAYSYRPYDQPKRPTRRTSNSDLSESSWAPSQSTARTSPPPSVRSHYSTKDPDKIVIKAVYGFMNQYAKTPASQLISGIGTVTDGLILRITTEGLFIDDDVRGVAQREWDVKAWTLKLVEVWCPVNFLAGAIAANSPPSPNASKPPNPVFNASNISTAFFAKTVGGSARLRAAERGAPKPMTDDAADDYLTDMLRCCKDSCRLGDCASKFAASNLPANHNEDASSMASGSTRVTNNTAQTGDWKAKGLHLLRATVRDQDGKRYLFIIGEEEGWKLSLGLQRLRRGTQARGLGVTALSGLETKTTLDLLGWG